MVSILIIAAALIAAAHCSTVEWTAIPSGISLPSAQDSSLTSAKLHLLNEYFLGLTARSPSGFDASGDLFSRPRALAVVTVDYLDSLPKPTKNSYQFFHDGTSQYGVDSQLNVVFGSERETLTVTKDAITGSKLADTSSQQKADSSAIKTKLEPLRSELEQVYKVVAALKAGGARLSVVSSPDFYQVHITGLASVYHTASDDELKTARNDIQNAINAFTSALVSVYGNQALMEVVSLSPAIDNSNDSAASNAKIDEPASAFRVKRAADDANVCDAQTAGAQVQTCNLGIRRQLFNVAVPVSPDYPATFAIFVGLILVLVLAVLFIAVGLWTMDPGKDSIIYRMTTTRMKKD